MATTFVSGCVLLIAASLIVANAVPAAEFNHRMEKRSADDKRDDAFMNDLASALGSMQRPRFGKRFMYYGPESEQFNNEKKSNSFAELESALGSMQRPRFGR